ncbi:MaoC family dehydratase N-terminal domain-containing protein [Halioxenophilus sp. WMMB6]|uniref:FAS1-like dehydratase domain-containing protein n=1 Tax=Halioxenophilus sp. WMMB6 TaxID=3073815 RepID=UPI00295E8E54|nr:MaoC family dehydratase N-terminal domain-containing protein [Halioxenophilus sp. WMMB6]
MSKTTLDTSDLDNYVGKRLRDAIAYEPVGANDIRRWAQAMHYPNRLHYDRNYSAESRFSGLIAPQSFAVAMDDGHGAVPACCGKIPDSHLIFGGDEWWFYGPHIKPGDLIHNERYSVDYVVKETSFAGPTCFQRGDNVYYNDQGDKIATQRSTGIRYNPNVARDMQSQSAADEHEPEWTQKQLLELEEKKFEWIKTLHDLGHNKRLLASVNVGDKLPTRIFGPHTIPSLTTEWRAFPTNLWGAMERLEEVADLGWVDEMGGYEQDGRMEKINPELTDGAYYGPSRGHLFTQYAQRIGMPRGYGYGASMGAYILDYLAGWAGEWGYVSYCNSQYRGPVFIGDTTVQNAEITEISKDELGRESIKLKVSMTNQNGTILATAKAAVILPSE